MNSPAATRLWNVPIEVSRVFELTGLGHLLSAHRPRIVIAMCESADAAEVSALCADLISTSESGRGFDVAPLDLPTVAQELHLEPRWQAIVVPPIQKWVGLDRADRDVRLIGRLTACAEQVVGIGTGTFMLAASGALDGHDVIASREHAEQLTALAPKARVHIGVSACLDDRLITVAAGALGLAAYTSLIAQTSLHW